MVTLDDLYNIATAMDEQMLLMNSKHKIDFRDGLTIHLAIPPLDLQGIDEVLYEREHNTLVGYEKGDEIDVRVLGINFKLTKKEDYDLLSPDICHACDTKQCTSRDNLGFNNRFNWFNHPEFNTRPDCAKHYTYNHKCTDNSFC